MEHRQSSTPRPRSRPPAARLYIDPIPEALRRVRTDATCGTHVRVGGSFLLFSEPVPGNRLVVAFHSWMIGGFTYVAILTAAHQGERLEYLEPRRLNGRRLFTDRDGLAPKPRGWRAAIHPRPLPPGITDLTRNGHFPDAAIRANRLGIWLAERWVQELREGTAPLCERRAPAAPDDGEAWLRRQLAGLGTDHP